MQAHPDLLIWGILAVAFIAGYSIVSAFINRIKSKTDERSNDRNETKFSDSNTPSLDDKFATLLGLAQPVVPSEVHDAFRRTLARYHPDKVEHLGAEFKEIAERKTKEIVEAYDYFRKKYGENVR